MKKLIITMLAIVLVLGSFTNEIAAEDAEIVTGYETTTLKVSDETNQVEAIGATLNVPNYIGSIDVTLETLQGTADATVHVVYVPNDKWDGLCYYSAMTARIRKYGAWLFNGSTEIVGWKDLYSYGFLPISGGTAVFSPDSAELHFLEGPGLYTALVSLPYSMTNTGYSNYSEALINAESFLEYTGIGFSFVLVLDDTSIDYFMKYGTLSDVASFTWPGLKDLLLSVQYQEVVESETLGFDNFIKKANYVRGMFLDMPFNVSPWYESYVEKSVELGLMKGSSNGMFLPEGDVKISEVIAMASRLHNIYYNGNGEFSQGPVWYNVYVNYALANGLIKEGDFSDYDRPATRGEMAYIFASALPAAALQEINTVERLPDVNAATAYDTEIFTLYRAGVLTGYADHSYAPEKTISRSETAAIISRMADETLRKVF